MDAWDIFCLTGHIDDYLYYRRAEGMVRQQFGTDAVHKEEKHAHGNISGADSGAAFSRREGEVY